MVHDVPVEGFDLVSSRRNHSKVSLNVVAWAEGKSKKLEIQSNVWPTTANESIQLTLVEMQRVQPKLQKPWGRRQPLAR